MLILCELIKQRGDVIIGNVLFRKMISIAWVEIIIIAAVYLISKIRIMYEIGTSFKFTVSLIIDTKGDEADKLTIDEIESFLDNTKTHPRLLRITIGTSIEGVNWFKELRLRIVQTAEKYPNCYIYGVGVNLYSPNSIDSIKCDDLSLSSMKKVVWKIIKPCDKRKEKNKLKCLDSLEKKIKQFHVRADINLLDCKKEINNQDKSSSKDSPRNYITSTKPDKRTKTFLVADIETILINDKHVPYAIGYTSAGERGSSLLELEKPVTYCTETFYYDGDMLERSNKMFDDFMNGLISYSKRCGTKKVYFHNLSRFDEVIILKYLINKKWTINPIIREHNIYQIKIYDKSNPRILVLDFRDSLKLLPGSLKSLAETMCPELGGKGSAGDKFYLVAQ